MILNLIVLSLSNCQKLLKVAVLVRHGARYPTHSDYDGNSTIQDWGELTSVGKRQHYNLGTILRKLYIKTY